MKSIVILVLFSSYSFAGIKIKKPTCYDGKTVSFDSETITIENKKQNFFGKFSNSEKDPYSIRPEVGQEVRICKKPISEKKLK